MGYTTTFEGSFKVEPVLSYEDRAELRARISDEEWPPVEVLGKPPNAYCQWRPTKEGSGLEWDGGEKFYDYDQWIVFLAAFLKMKGDSVSGSVRFRGESFEDAGVLSIVDGQATKTGIDPSAWADVTPVMRARVLEAIADAARGAAERDRDAFAAALAMLGAKPRTGR